MRFFALLLVLVLVLLWLVVVTLIAIGRIFDFP